MGQLPQVVINQAAAINQKLTDAVTAARNDATLSTTGRNAKIAVAYKAATSAMQAVADNYEATNQLAATSLSRELFGATSSVGVDAISFRDAADRAAAVQSPEEALSLLQRADRGGDRVLVRAIASHATDEASDPITGFSWLPVLDAFASSYGSGAEMTTVKINKLLDLQQPGDATSSLTAAAHLHIPRPVEIQRMTQGELDAAGDTSGRSAFPPPATDRIGA